TCARGGGGRQLSSYRRGVPSVAALTLAPWSVSKVQCALRCPLEFHFRYVDRLHEPEVAPETRVGKAVHGALEAVLGRTPVADALAAAGDSLLSVAEAAAFVALSADEALLHGRIRAST